MLTTMSPDDALAYLNAIMYDLEFGGGDGQDECIGAARLGLSELERKGFADVAERLRPLVDIMDDAWARAKARAAEIEAELKAEAAKERP